jgi:putative spermidine/putrescine transport system substrate-binding protein
MIASRVSRRDFLATGLSLGVLAGFPAERARAQQKTLVAATFPASWHEMHRTVLVPYFKRKTGADVTLTIQLAVDVVTKLVAARGGKPPFDVAMLDYGPLLDAIKQNILVEYPNAKSAHFKDLVANLQDKWGPKVTVQIIGIGYNPKRVKTPPKSWDDLWNPVYKGRVGLTALNSSLGMAFMAEIARLKGGSESNVEPGFRALRDLLPNVGAISANLGAHATLFQQEVVDIAPHNFNFVETLKGRGVDIEFVVPETGPVGWTTSLHIVANAVEADLAFQYIESAITPEVQAQMQQAPHWVIPTNTKVPLTGPIQQKLGKSVADFAKVRVHDWAKINEQRPAWIDRFNREIKL